VLFFEPDLALTRLSLHRRRLDRGWPLLELVHALLKSLNLTLQRLDLGRWWRRLSEHKIRREWNDGDPDAEDACQETA
jgi:hypothetical protein